MGEVGILQWFHFEDRACVERAITDLGELGIIELRTGFSWADWYRPGGKEWFDWLIPKLGAQFRILPSFTYTPPQLGMERRTNAPPRDIAKYAEFIDEALARYGQYFDHVELWNEPDNNTEWNSRLDPGHKRFCRMIIAAAKVAKARGKRTVLGGMSHLDPEWLRLIAKQGTLAHIDIVGLHGFPGTWEKEWCTWKRKVELVQEVLDEHKSSAAISSAAIWITEAGFSTWQRGEEAQQEQLRRFRELLAAPVERVYWYSLYDLASARRTVREATGGKRDIKEYHFGLKTSDGQEKLLFGEWKNILASAQPKKPLAALASGLHHA